MTKSRFTVDVKSINPESDEHPNGSFECILSTDALDRDDEIVDPYAFQPTPSSIPIFTDHETWNVKSLVARVIPTYLGDGRLHIKGYFGSDAYSQEIRQKVLDGLIVAMSVGFRAADRKHIAGVQHVVKAELLEGSFVGVPANPEALITAAKSFTDKNVKADTEALTSAHDALVAAGAVCKHDDTEEHVADDDKPKSTEAPPAPAGTEQQPGDPGKAGEQINHNSEILNEARTIEQAIEEMELEAEAGSLESSLDELEAGTEDEDAPSE